MPWANNPKIDALRRKYNAAFAAHHVCDRALIGARNAGDTPSPEAKEAELRTREELTRARDQLLAAITEAITGHAAVKLRPPAPVNEPEK
jgi:hypothetical protein